MCAHAIVILGMPFFWDIILLVHCHPLIMVQFIRLAIISIVEIYDKVLPPIVKHKMEGPKKQMIWTLHLVNRQILDTIKMHF